MDDVEYHYLVFTSIDEGPDGFETYGEALMEALRLVDKIKNGKVAKLKIEGDFRILCFRIQFDKELYTPWVQLRTIG